MRLIMLGPPGAGKGTQAEILRSRFDAVHLSTGDVLRRHVDTQSELGRKAKTFMDKGELVPDDVIIAMVEDELKGRKDFILDGFPRTLAQADALGALLERLALPLDAVICLAARQDVLVERLSSRWVNPRTGRTYNTQSNPPKVAGRDDDDGGELIQRPDDRSETVRRRLEVYDAQTAPLIAYYEQRGLLRQVDALAPIDQVTAAVIACIQTVGAGKHGA